jgi:glycosyltransferase involved in cell wall biosynthesis
MVSKIKGSKLVYDSHEYFTEVPELQNSPFKKSIWKAIERFIFPKLKHVFTVNESIKNLYEKEYGVKVNVVRNLPSIPAASLTLTTEELGLPSGKRIVILQGAGINVDRGAEEAVEAMQFVNEDAILLIVGSGDVVPFLKRRVTELKLAEKVFFIDKQPFDRLRAITKLAAIGLTLDKDTNINYKFSLPNKLFDYVQAGVPVLASRLTEIEKIINEYPVGLFIESHDPREIASKIDLMLTDKILYDRLKSATIIASRELSWENEEKTLEKVYKPLLASK